MEGGQWRDVHGDHHPSINHVHACKGSANIQKISKAFPMHRHASTGMQMQFGFNRMDIYRYMVNS